MRSRLMTQFNQVGHDGIQLVVDMFSRWGSWQHSWSNMHAEVTRLQARCSASREMVVDNQISQSWS